MEKIIKYRDYFVTRQQYYSNIQFEHLAEEYQTIINYFNQFIEEKKENVQDLQQ